MQRVFRRLQRLGLDANLVTCVTADHGEQLGEHGVAGGHTDIYRETVRVPLFIAGPGIPRGRRQELVSLLDVAPSLLARAGARFTARIDGFDLLASPGKEPAVGTRSLLVLGYPSYTRSLSVVEEPWTYIWNLDYRARSVFVEPVKQFRPADAAEGGYRQIDEGPGEGTGTSFHVERSGLEPHYLEIVALAAQPDCAATVSVRVAPGSSLASVPTHLGRDLRFVLPVSLLDHATVVVDPALRRRHLPAHDPC